MVNFPSCQELEMVLLHHSEALQDRFCYNDNTNFSILTSVTIILTQLTYLLSSISYVSDNLHANLIPA